MASPFGVAASARRSGPEPLADLEVVLSHQALPFLVLPSAVFGRALVASLRAALLLGVGHPGRHSPSGRRCHRWAGPAVDAGGGEGDLRLEDVVVELLLVLHPHRLGRLVEAELLQDGFAGDLTLGAQREHRLQERRVEAEGDVARHEDEVRLLLDHLGQVGLLVVRVLDDGACQLALDGALHHVPAVLHHPGHRVRERHVRLVALTACTQRQGAEQPHQDAGVEDVVLLRDCRVRSIFGAMMSISSRWSEMMTGILAMKL
jgi:hypothetical protein